MTEPKVTPKVRRKLTAILAADMVGYSRLMEADEGATIARLKAHRAQLIDPEIEAHGGRIVKTTGDGLLVEFASVVDAVASAVAIQRALGISEAGVAEERRMRYRMGINIGDIVIDGDDILGDGVNLAARLEELAEPGGIALSASAHEHVSGKLEISFEDAGEYTVKNIARPIHVWRWHGAASAAAPAPAAGPILAAERLTLPDKPSIAVLPFDNMSGDPEQEYFADGITEDIITGLSALRWLFVIARNSSFTYKGRAVDVTEVARDLGVRYVLEGSVRRAGERLRVSAQLIDGATANHVWAQRYERRLDDVFALQDEITQTIVAAIEPEVASAERERATRKPPGNLGAWEAYQRGLWHHYHFTPEQLGEAKRFLGQAIELDPSFAPAYASLAFVHFHDVAWGKLEPSESAQSLDRGLELATKAIALDNNDALAHATMGRLSILKGDYPSARAELERARDLNPNSALTYSGLGAVEAFTGNAEEGIRYAQQALRLSPRDPMRWAMMVLIAYSLIRLERYEEALDWARRTTREPHAVFWPYAHVVVCLVALERIDEAREALAELLRIEPKLTIQSIDSSAGYVTDRKTQDRYHDALRKAGLPE